MSNSQALTTEGVTAPNKGDVEGTPTDKDLPDVHSLSKPSLDSDKNTFLAIAFGIIN